MTIDEHQFVALKGLYPSWLYIFSTLGNHGIKCVYYGLILIKISNKIFQFPERLDTD